MFYKKYLKYKMKYHQLKQIGGVNHVNASVKDSVKDPVKAPVKARIEGYDITMVYNEEGEEFTVSGDSNIYELKEINEKPTNKTPTNKTPMLLRRNFCFHVKITYLKKDSQGEKILEIDFKDPVNNKIEEWCEIYEKTKDNQDCMTNLFNIFRVISRILIFQVEHDEITIDNVSYLHSNVSKYNSWLQILFDTLLGHIKIRNKIDLDHVDDKTELLLAVHTDWVFNGADRSWRPRVMTLKQHAEINRIQSDFSFHKSN